MLTIVFDLDGTLIDTAPDLIDTLNVTLAREGLPAVRFGDARPMIGGGARGMIERALAADGRHAAKAEIDRILRETIADPVGPEFMAPPPRPEVAVLQAAQ